MPAPLAKGIVVTVSAIVAAGIAVYQNPQVKEWILNSRQKIAFALHNLGDEISPEERRREDISMTEDIGDEAAERRRQAREEIMQRAEHLESQRKRRTTSVAGSFDALVDEDGRLKKSDDDLPASARATGMDMQTSQLKQRHPENDTHTPGQPLDPVSDSNLQRHHEMLDSMDPMGMHLRIPSEVSSAHPSESLVALTPTSEFPDADLGPSNDNETREAGHTPLRTEYVSAISSRSSRTEEGDGGFYYAPPVEVQNPTKQGSQTPPQFSNQAQGNTTPNNASSAPSLTSSMEHIRHDSFAGTSDGTMSEADYVRDVHTPISWSEVGSVISSNDGSHR